MRDFCLKTNSFHGTWRGLVDATIKVLVDEVLDFDLQHINKEYIILKKLEHPNVVQVR